VDSSDDSTAEVNGTDPSKVKRLQELEQKLEKMYSSLDTNNGVLEDNYLIPYVVNTDSPIAKCAGDRSEAFVSHGQLLFDLWVYYCSHLQVVERTDTKFVFP